MTLILLTLLEVNYIDKKSNWILVHKKAISWLKYCEINFYDICLKKINIFKFFIRLKYCEINFYDICNQLK